jgi:exopolyphosphatase/guanosine-5'-triphosphate,3'-diphosphate pyrophosphatase
MPQNPPVRGRAPQRNRTSRVPPPLAVIDIGSNSGRVTVVRLHPSGHLEVLADARMPLRLARDVDDSGRLSRGGIQRTLDALHDFRAVALGAGATSILAVATSAVREAVNGTALVQAARSKLGIRLAVIDGVREATFAFLGAVHGLPVDHGLLFDLGGGSLEVSYFRDRKLRDTWTLPLGALRVSDRFIESDPPTRAQLDRLRRHVRQTLRRAGVPRLRRDEELIGTGGTVRNIAKIQLRSRREALPRVHGTVIRRAQVKALARRVTKLRQAGRGALPGLNRDRADSFVGGVVTVALAMDFVGAESLQVSGQGLREGIALATLGRSPLPAATVRRGSVEALLRRFTIARLDIGRRRAKIADHLLDLLVPDPAAELRETLAHACLVLDVGRSIDYYERHRNAAAIVAAADLQGFTQRGLALLFAVLMRADNATNRIKALGDVLHEHDGEAVERAAILLLLADEIERRSLPGQPMGFRARGTSQSLVLVGESLTGWRPRSLGDRFRRAFRRQLRVASR